MPVTIDEAGGRRAAPRGFALFQYGFRPFFLLAGLQAALAVPVWLAIWRGDLGWQPAMPANIWHGHEMLFGFAAAALAGFLLTAVPNWTGTAAIKGPRLMLLVAVWLAARVAAYLPDPLAFRVFDIGFLLLLAAMVGPGIILRNARRNGGMVVILLLLAAINAAVHFDGFGLAGLDAGWALRLGIAVFALMVGMIGGRIVPAFTIGGMRMAGWPLEIPPLKPVEIGAMLSLLAFALATALRLPEPVLGAAAAIAALFNLVRFLRWQGWKTWRVPLVWVLHLGYGWLVIGLALSAGAHLTAAVPESAAIHALTAGAFATMILAVMSRAALGHTGRQLVAGRAVTIAYHLVTCGALLRIVGPFGGTLEPLLISAGGICWSVGFLVFALRYLPILVAARPDGRPG